MVSKITTKSIKHVLDVMPFSASSNLSVATWGCTKSVKLFFFFFYASLLRHYMSSVEISLSIFQPTFHFKVLTLASIALCCLLYL